MRFNVAKTLSIVGPKLNTGVMVAQVKPCINKLNEDSDFDVRFFASEAAMGELSLAFSHAFYATVLGLMKSAFTTFPIHIYSYNVVLIYFL